jgi:hypothetical protein
MADLDKGAVAHDESKIEEYSPISWREPLLIIRAFL